MLRTYKHQEIDRILMVDSAWEGTQRRWYSEGMPKNVGWEEYFASDHSIPKSVSFDNMKEIAALAHKLGKY